MKHKGQMTVAADITDISKVEMKQLLEQYFLEGPTDTPIEARGPMKEMVFALFNLLCQMKGSLELVALRAKQQTITEVDEGGKVEEVTL